MQSSLKVTVEKPDPRICPKCGAALKLRNEKLPGRYHCPIEPEGEGEFVITKEFYKNLLQGSDIQPPHLVMVTPVHDHYTIFASRIPRKNRRCSSCNRWIHELKLVRFTMQTNISAVYQNACIPCARKMGLTIMEEVN